MGLYRLRRAHCELVRRWGERARECARSAEAMPRWAVYVTSGGSRRVVSRRTAVLPRRRVWEGRSQRLHGALPGPDVTITVRASTTSRGPSSTSRRMERPSDGEQSGSSTGRDVPRSSCCARRDKGRPSRCDARWTEWLFGTAIAKADDQLGRTWDVASSNLSTDHTGRTHGTGLGAEFDGGVSEESTGTAARAPRHPAGPLRKHRRGFAPLPLTRRGVRREGSERKGAVLRGAVRIGTAGQVSLDERSASRRVAAGRGARIGDIETLGEQARGLFRRRAGSRR